MESVEIIHQELNVPVSGHGAAVKRIVLVEVAKAVDAGIPAACSGTRPVVGNQAIIERVMRGIVFEADSVCSLNTILNR